MIAPPNTDTRIDTRRLLIRPPRRGDFEAWAQLRGKSRNHLEPWEPLWPTDALSREDWARRLRAWRTGWRNDRSFVFLILLRGSEPLIGGVSLTNIRRGAAQTGALGYWLGAGYEGFGYMREAVSAVCQWSFNRLRLERLEAATLPENARSRRVLESCGFHEEGFAPGYLEIGGVRRDHVLYGRVSTMRAPKR